MIAQQLGQQLHVKFVFRDHATGSSAGHGRQHGGVARVASEDLHHQKAFVRSGGGAQPVRHLDGAGDAGTEADAIIGSGNVVVHRLGNRNHLHAFLVEPHAVAQRVIATDGDQEIDAEPCQGGQHLRRQIVALLAVFFLEMGGNGGLFHLAGIGARGVQEGAAAARRAIDDLFAQDRISCPCCHNFLAHDIDQAGPSAADADHLVALAQGADGHGANGGIQSRNIATAGQDAYDALFRVYVCHFGCS